MAVATPLTGSLVTADLDVILDTNLNVLNSIGDPSSATFNVLNEDGELRSEPGQEVIIDGGEPTDITYIGAGTFSTAGLTIGLPPLAGVTVTLNPVQVGLFQTQPGGENYLVSEDPLDATNLRASVSGTLAGIPLNLVDANLTEVADALGLSLNGLLNDLVFSLDITPGAPLNVDGVMICFVRGTMIETADGPVAVEELKADDLVMTKDRGLQPVRWIGSQRLSATALRHMPELRPIRIKAGALGLNTPSADLIVSPQHRILVRSGIAQKMFGAREVLVAAKQLVLLEGIDIADDYQEVEYFHFMFDKHEVVISNGAETESLFTGREAMKAVGGAARKEILAIFPQLAQGDYQPTAARVLASGRMGRRMAVRHGQNRKALVQ